MGLQAKEGLRLPGTGGDKLPSSGSASGFRKHTPGIESAPSSACYSPRGTSQPAPFAGYPEVESGARRVGLRSPHTRWYVQSGCSVSQLGCMGGAVFVFWGSYNKSPQTGGLQATDVYCLLVLEAGNPTLRCPQGRAPSQDSRGSFFLTSSSFLLFQVSLCLWPCHSSLCLCLHEAPSSLCLGPNSLALFSYKNTSH